MVIKAHSSPGLGNLRAKGSSYSANGDEEKLLRRQRIPKRKRYNKSRPTP